MPLFLGVLFKSYQAAGHVPGDKEGYRSVPFDKSATIPESKSVLQGKGHDPVAEVEA